MKSNVVLERIPSGARAAVIRLRSLGDCVLTTPALELLHDARPDLRIAVIVETWLAPVFAGNPAVSEILPPSISRLRSWKPQLCLNLHGGTQSAWLTARSGSPLRAGFGHFRFQPAYNIHIPKAQEILGVDRIVHTAEHLASAMFFLGVPQTEIPRARLFARGPATRAREYAVIHPFASSPDKTWPAERFVALARALSSQFEIVFIGGTNDSMSAFDGFVVVQGSDLEELKSLLGGASLFVGNDSGPAHMAAALGVPLVMLWGNSRQEIWAPWRAEHVLVSDSGGIGQISVDVALDAVDRLRVKA